MNCNISRWMTAKRVTKTVSSTFTVLVFWLATISCQSIFCQPNGADDTFRPYSSDNVAKDMQTLWKDYDPSKEKLESKVVREWKADGVVTRYVTFTVGTFKGTKARIAAYYSFPAGTRNNAAFVWSHGGGQRAERGRGVYFAKQGYATVDINWLGRSMEPDIEINTDWGKVDPTQGPRFYPKALRPNWKLDFQPDKHTLDPVPSPRNSNWFLLAVAARRAITFLENQPEVDADRIGFAGYSMGGMITALTAPDPRLKAVVPFVGGTGFKHIDFAGIPGTSLKRRFQDPDHYQQTLDPSSYWPEVKCPVMFITSSNDFHSTFERVNRSMKLLTHDRWRVSANVHQNHGPGAEQWGLLNLWFDKYLKGKDIQIPKTPSSRLKIKDDVARFFVTPETEGLLSTEIYYSYDPNPRTRFWNRATIELTASTKSARIPMHQGLPFFVFAQCRYQLPKVQQLERGSTSTVMINSLEHEFVPATLHLSNLGNLIQKDEVFEDFSNGVRDWASRDQRTISTYKFQSPRLDRSNNKKLAISLSPKGKNLLIVLRVSSKFLAPQDNLGDFTFRRPIHGTQPVTLKIDRTEFESKDGKTLEWSKIGNFSVTIVERTTGEKLKLAEPNGTQVLNRIELID